MARGGPQRIPRPPGARAGAPAPWAHLADVDRVLDLEHIAAALAASPPPARSPLEDDGAAASAVLAPLHDRDGEPHVIVTRRAQHLRSHRGEVSFPGGRQEAGESLWQTALREAQEEIALDPAAVRHIGELDHLSTVTATVFIVPYVVVVDPVGELEANPDEVELIRHVPLRELLADGVFHQELWGIRGLERPIDFFELEDETIWGATARMLHDLLARITGTTPARPEAELSVGASSTRGRPPGEPPNR